METRYYDPQFYVVSDKMPFTIRVEIKLKHSIDGDVMQEAVNRSIKRYPYFAMKVVREGEEYKTEENTLPLIVYRGKEVYALGSKEVNYHMLAIRYESSEIDFMVSHVITDGGGFFPFIKTVLYYYESIRRREEIESAGFNLEDSEIEKEEIINPYPEEIIKKAEPFYVKEVKDCFKVKDGGYVKEKDNGKVYRFKISYKEAMNASYDNDGSPNALISSLMAKAIWRVHPQEEKSIVSAVSFNMRSGLRNKRSYRMLSSALKVEYPKRLKDENVLKLCTCTRGTISLQSQAENVWYECRKRKEFFDSIKDLSLEEKKRIVGEKALEDATNNTYSVSYVGRVDYGAIKDEIEADYNITDGSTYKTIFIEIGAVEGWFSIAFIQGFDSEVYYRALLKEIENFKIPYIEEGVSELNTPKIELP